MPIMRQWIFYSAFAGLLCGGLIGCRTVEESESGSLFEGEKSPEVLVATQEQTEVVTDAERTGEPNRESDLMDDDADLASAEGIDISRKRRYKVRGQHYEVFNSGKNFQQIGVASWYGPGFHGKLTANGEVYDMYAMTAAHKTLPLGSRVQVTNLSNGKKIIVRINDRGPFHGGRIIDLSKKAAKALGILKAGQTKVHVKTID